jgi:3'(2'), 5'-bisphosphate nucleotidase
MLTQEQRDFLLPKAYNAALRAGAAILRIYEKGAAEYDISIKSDHTPLTEADSRAHEIIKEHLGRTHVPVLSEEGREMLYLERKAWDLFWMVDPLDGTKEFIKGNGEFTVNIALMSNNRPVLSVVYVPYIGKMYFAAHGLGSFLCEQLPPDDNADKGIDEILAGATALPIAHEINSPLRVAVSRSHTTPETFAAIDTMRGEYPDLEIVYQGSSYKFGLLAEGTVDYYVRTTPTMEWDTAAGELVLELAGGSTHSFPCGEQLKYNKESLVNPCFECRSRYMFSRE